MVRVEVAGVLEHILAAGVDDGLPEALGEPGFPVCATVLMRKVSDEETSGLDVHAEFVINESSLLVFVETP
jgi:hypothetical protein